MWCCRHKGLSGGAVAGIVVAVSLTSFLLGLAVFAGYQRHRARRKARAEVAFEAALQDSGLGLDDAFEQVCHCMTSNILGRCYVRIAVSASSCAQGGGPSSTPHAFAKQGPT